MIIFSWPRSADLPFWRKYRKFTGHVGKGWGGFLRFRLDNDQATVQVYIEDGKMEYEERIAPRSQKIFD
jgi:hypothetical protein